MEQTHLFQRKIFMIIASENINKNKYTCETCQYACGSEGCIDPAQIGKRIVDPEVEKYRKSIGICVGWTSKS